MKSYLRAVLADSHIAVAAVAVFLLWSFEAVVEAFSQQFTCVTYLAANALAALGIEHSSTTYSIEISWDITILYLCYGGVMLAAAWLLSRWAFDAGPLHVFHGYYVRLSKRSHA